VGEYYSDRAEWQYEIRVIDTGDDDAVVAYADPLIIINKPPDPPPPVP
jgi:hypothetical protein